MRFLSKKSNFGFVLLFILAPLVIVSESPSQALAPDSLKAVTYRSIGPTAQSGRFVDFAVPQQEPFTFYAATGSGGLWKTVNNGTASRRFSTTKRSFPSATSPWLRPIPSLWVGTGEANNSRCTYWGDGVYKSTDAGKTWKNMGLKESHHIGRIVIHPTNPDIVYVAALGHLYTENPDRGLYKTTDGGKTWTKAFWTSTVSGRSIGVVDVVMDPANPEVLLRRDLRQAPQALDLPDRRPRQRHLQTDRRRRKTWTKLDGGLPGRDPRPNRPGHLSQEPEDPLRRHRERQQARHVPEAALAGDPGRKVERGDDRRRGLSHGRRRRDLAEGQPRKAEHRRAAPATIMRQIIIDPNRRQARLRPVASAFQESKDGGKTWDSAFRFGGDNHALWIDPKDSNHMLLGYDHGMGVTFDGGKNWLPSRSSAPGPVLRRRISTCPIPTAWPAASRTTARCMGPSTKPARRRPIRLRRLVPRSAAATACTTSSTARPTAISTTNPSSGRSAGSTW